MQERGNVLRIFKETLDAMKRGDTAKIKALSNQTINTASLSQDPDNIAVAVVIYSLGKILERHQYQEFSGWNKFYNGVFNSINHAVRDLETNNDNMIRVDIEDINKQIERLSGKLKRYIQDVFWKAKINKASRIYEHGISMEKTAKLLGITLYELASYTGQATRDDVPLENTMDVRKRVKLAEDFFK
ncbi:MAG: hypothetical protein WD876_03760 [Candidatus Pacearchaeota archaeon]